MPPVGFQRRNRPKRRVVYSGPTRATKAPSRPAPRPVYRAPVYRGPTRATKAPPPAPRRPAYHVAPAAKRGYGGARDKQAKAAAKLSYARSRGYGGARDTQARTAAAVAAQRARGYGGARDVQAGKAARLRAQQARGFGGASDRAAKQADLKRRLTNQLNYLTKRSAARGGYSERELFGRKTDTIEDLRRGIRIAEAGPSRQHDIVRTAALKQASLNQAALLRKLRPVTAPASAALEYTLRPVHAVAAAAKSDIREIKKKGLTGAIGGGQGAQAAKRGITGKDKTLFSDVLAEAGVHNKLARGVGGFLLDVGLDPTTYLTGGVSSVGRRTLLRSGQKIQRLATASKADELTRSIATRVRTGELKTRSQVRKARKQASIDAREYGRKRARAHIESNRHKIQEGNRGIKIGVAGQTQRAAEKTKRASKVRRRDVRKLVRDPKAQLKGRRPRELPAKLRDLDVKTTGKIGQVAGAGGTHTPGRAARFARAVGAGAHAGVRPVGIEGREFRDIKAIKRESRAKSEKMTRRAAARANALLGHLNDDERELVINAIERDDIASLSAPAIRKRLQARHPGATPSMIEDMLHDEVVRIGRVTSSTLGDRALNKMRRRLERRGYSDAEIDKRLADVKTGAIGRLPVPKPVRGQVARAPIGVKGKRIVGRVKAPVGVRRSLASQAARDPNRLHRVASDVQSEIRYIEREGQRSGILAGRVGKQSRTRTEARLAAKTRRPTLREESARRSQAQLLPAMLREAQGRAARTRAVSAPETAWFKPRPNAKNPPHGKGYLDPKGKLHTWPESEGAHAEVLHARGHDPVDSPQFTIRPDGTVAFYGETLGFMPEAEAIARVLAQDSRLKAPEKLRRAVGMGLNKVAKEYAPKATPAQRAADTEVRRLGGLLDKTREQIMEIPVRRAEAAAYGQEARRTKKGRLSQEAKGYFPRGTRQELSGGELAEVAGKVPETYDKGRVGSTVAPPPTKQRKYRKTREDLSRGSHDEQAVFESLSDDVRATLAQYGSQMARGMGAADLNRSIATLGRALPARLGGGASRQNARTALKAIEDGGEKVYFLHRGRLIPVDTSDRQEFAKLIRSTRTHGRGGQRRANAGLGGRYVLLRPEVVHQAQKEGKLAGADTALGEAWDVAHRGFKTGALLTPGYLVRNLLGDLWNAHTEENVFRMGRNLVRGQKALNALGRYERGLRNFRKRVPANQRTIKLTEGQASAFHQAMGRSGPPKREVDAMEVALLAERSGVIRQGRFVELMEEGARGQVRTPSGWHDLSKRVEDSVRIGTFLGALQHGQTPREAAARATKVHFDYADLTTAEKTIARRVMPFYTFTARNIPLQAKTLATKPGKFANVEKAREEGRRNAGLPAGYDRNLNPYEARQLGLPFKIGGKTYTLSAGSPFVDLNDIVTAGQGPRGAIEAGVRRGAELTTPLKTIFEVTAGKEGYSAFFREPIRREGEPTTRAPAWAAWLARKFPEFGKASGYTDRYAPPEGGGATPGWDRKWDYVFRQLQIGPINSLVELAGLGVKKGTNARDMGKIQTILTDLGVRAPETTHRKRALERTYRQIERNSDEQDRLRRQYKPGTDERISADNPTKRYNQLRGEAKYLETRKNRLLTAERPEGFVAGRRVRKRKRGAHSGPSTAGGVALPPLSTTGPATSDGVALPPLR